MVKWNGLRRVLGLIGSVIHIAGTMVAISFLWPILERKPWEYVGDPELTKIAVILMMFGFWWAATTSTRVFQMIGFWAPYMGYIGALLLPPWVVSWLFVIGFPQDSTLWWMSVVWVVVQLVLDSAETEFKPR